MLISAFTRTQIAALFGTAILTILPAMQFSGMLTPVSSLTGDGARSWAACFPMTYFLPISVGTFTKGLGFRRSRREPCRAGAVRPGADAAEPPAAAQAGALAAMRTLANIFWLGTKELRSFFRDFVLLGLRDLFLLARRSSRRRRAPRRSCTTPRSRSSTRIIRELSRRIAQAFLPPYFKPPQPIAERDIDRLMNAGRYTFVIDIPPHFERDVLGGRQPALQLDVDATAMMQAGIGSGYAQQIIDDEIADFLSRAEGGPARRSTSTVRIAFNPNVDDRAGSPASWASSTTSPCWRSSSPARRSCASASTARWTICWSCR